MQAGSQPGTETNRDLVWNPAELDWKDLVWNPAELDWKNKCLLRSQAVANALRHAARHAGRLTAGH